MKLLFDSFRRKQTKKETIPYPICSVVAVFKMLIRILNTLQSRIWDRVLFLFSVFWLQKEWMQSSLGERRGRDQKTTAYSEGISSEDYFLSLMSSKEKGLVISWEIKVVTFRVILLRDVRHITHGTHQEKTIYCDKIMINISCTTIACSIILSSVKLEKRFSIAERVSSRLLTSPPYPSQRLLHSFLLEPTSRK